MAIGRTRGGHGPTIGRVQRQPDAILRCVTAMGTSDREHAATGSLPSLARVWPSFGRHAAGAISLSLDSGAMLIAPIRGYLRANGANSSNSDPRLSLFHLARFAARCIGFLWILYAIKPSIDLEGSWSHVDAVSRRLLEERRSGQICELGRCRANSTRSRLGPPISREVGPESHRFCESRTPSPNAERPFQRLLLRCSEP